MTLPSRPQCFPATGVIACDCHSRDKRKRNDCMASRHFWMAAKTVAEMPSNKHRRGYLDWISSLTRAGPSLAADLRAAAKELMAQLKEAA